MFLLNNTELFLSVISLIGFVILSLYYLIAYARPLRASKQIDRTFEESNKIPVSIIIYAKNSAENLKKHLPALLTQDYPEYQVIVINDGSSDDTDDTLKSFQNEYKHLYHTYIPSNVRYLSRRKLAFTLGAKAARYDILLFTEANCQPLNDQWLSAMVGRYTPETSIVLGYCKYGNYKGLFHKLIAYDNLLTGLRYLSSALSHHPYTGNGRNLSYRKELFFKHKGFYQSLNLHAGDDDLFINEASTKENTRVTYTPDSLTEMDRIERFGVWKEMKISRASTQRYYKGNALTFYHLESACFFLFQASVIAAVVIGLSGNWLVSLFAVLLYLIRFIIKAIVFGKSARMLQQSPAIGWLFLLEFIQPMFNGYVRIYRLFRNSKDYTFRLEN
ncbi:glycosyltransferase [uncultured Parabacteroides sp.]|uniref:glycosyltransferase family 2 protein n=1 Tax=uncultured Parabacteroides sp. TaxID=512312 RepID=UPI00262F94FC|nr:glycosyltransferase [uncultured Parabacteroides sp.]